MREEPITLKEGIHLLKGVLTRQTGSRGLVMAHPHPLYGGDMNNPVVTTVTRTFAHAGYATLRFNLRGVGAGPREFADSRKSDQPKRPVI